MPQQEMQGKTQQLVGFAMDERDDFKLLKQRLHRKVLDRLDLAKLGQTPNATAREQVLNFIRNLISDEVTPLSDFERERLAREIHAEIFGLGPLEQLMKDPGISDILVNGFNQIYIERAGKLESVQNVSFKDNQHLMQIIDRIVSSG